MKKQVIQHETKQLFDIWKAIKQKYSDVIVVIRTEEMYTTFGYDAILINQVASVKLTRDKEGRRQCCFPLHRLDKMLPELTKADYQIAVCEQFETPKR
jgi:DNA mismatch repair ATPase MutS